MALYLFVRGNRANQRADRWKREFNRLSQDKHWDGIAQQWRDVHPFPGQIWFDSAPRSREDRVNTKLRDRCVSLESQLQEAQDEIKKLTQKKGISHAKV